MYQHEHFQRPCASYQHGGPGSMDQAGAPGSSRGWSREGRLPAYHGMSLPFPPAGTKEPPCSKPLCLPENQVGSGHSSSTGYWIRPQNGSTTNSPSWRRASVAPPSAWYPWWIRIASGSSRGWGLRPRRPPGTWRSAPTPSSRRNSSSSRMPWRTPGSRTTPSSLPNRGSASMPAHP